MIAKRIGDYDLIEELGAGAMGSVYLARKNGEPFALKIIHEQLGASEALMQRFVREARAGRRVRHPNVVRVFEAGSEAVDGKDVHYLVMEYVEGKDLRELLDDLGEVPETLLREIGRQIAAGLEAIHAAGVIHRDLKPENVLITGANEIRIMDLGVAKLQDATVALTRAGQFTGTVLYASPEQFHDDEVGPSSDLYALGVLLYELATGRNPFFRRDPVAVIQAHLEHVPPPVNDVVPDLSSLWAEVLQTLLAKRVEERFDSAAALRVVLDEAEASRWWARREPDLLRRRRRLPRIPVQRRTALHGRERELERMGKAWQAAARGEGGLLLVEGESGIGKSRLLDTLLERVGRGEAHVLYGAFSPTGGLRGLTDAVVGFLGASDLESSLEPHLEASRELLPAFAARLRGESPPEGAAVLDDEGFTTLLVRLMRSLAAERPLLWLVDDLHLARDEGRRVLASLAQAARTAPVLLVAAAQSGGLGEADEGLADVERIELARLGARDVVDLLTDVLQNDSLAERLSGKIAVASDGVPYFVFELLRSLDESGSLERRSDGTWSQARHLTEIEVPPNVRELLRARLAELPDEDRELLDAAAVQGHAFDAGLVAAVLEEKRVHVLRRLAVIERRTGMVRAQGGVYLFDQKQLQETLLAEIPPELGAEYHALLAEAFAARIEGEPSGADAHFLGRHLLQGPRPADGLPHLDAALAHLQKAAQGDAFLDLARLALGREGVLSGAHRARVLLRLAEMLSTLTGHREVDAPVEEACGLAEAAGDVGLRADIQYLKARMLLVSGDPGGALEALDAVKTLAHEAGKAELEARATGIVGVVFDKTARHEEALPYLEHHLSVARELGDARSEQIAACNLSLALRNVGRLAEARTLMERHLELARTLDDLRSEAVAHGNLALVASDEGDDEDADRHALRNIELARKIGARHSEATASHNLGVQHRFVGDLGKAWTWLGRAYALFRELDVTGMLAGTALGLGRLLTCFGRHDLALEYRDLARAGTRAVGRDELVPARTFELATTHASVGRRADARGLLREALEGAREADDGALVARVLWALADLADDETEAGRLSSSAAATTSDDPWHRLRLLARQGTDLVTAREAAAAIVDPVGALDDLERSYLAWKAGGDADALAEAKRLLNALVTSAPASFRASMRENVPMHREIESA